MIGLAPFAVVDDAALQPKRPSFNVLLVLFEPIVGGREGRDLIRAVPFINFPHGRVEQEVTFLDSFIVLTSLLRLTKQLTQAF